ncbi:EAL domain-containing protein [Thioalkalivibrio sp. XN8]|uniref:EAL domain-containing protein n=1 Tax=Thioalkalivibrio sp. XN8 TaxID=2712863 RepID=UPI0013ECCEAD|nr:EAL domain-containing protein [Thioalkalivibrio sp. XN8]NGP52234.1 EAL domain-containing protein [Thioalkalivibrio sp. XN8]
MPLLETATIAIAAGILSWLGVSMWRRRSVPRQEAGPGAMHMTADTGRLVSMPARSGEAGPGGGHPLAGLGDQALFISLAERISDAVLLHDENIHYSNAAAETLLGAGAPLAGRRLAELLEDGQEDAFAAWLQARRAGRQSVVALRLRDENGRVLECELSGFPVPQDDGVLGTVVRLGRDEMLRSARRQGTQLAEATLDSISEGVVITDLRGHIDYLNTAAEALLDCTLEQARGRMLGDIAALVDEADRHALPDPVRRCLDEGRRIDVGRRSLLVARASGKELSVEMRASPIKSGGHEPSGCVVVLHDVSELRGITRQMSYQASHDPLTGLANRREFERRLEDALQQARSRSTSHVLCYLDLDRFKAVNDTSGHTAGDNMLRELAAILSDKVRDSDVIARVGGDEFGMLLMGCPLDKARQIADDVCSAIRDFNFVWRDKIYSVGVSVGLVQIGPESGALEDVLSAADSACYIAKQQGRGRVHVYSARDEAAARQRGEILWLQRLQSALKEDRFELRTQPIVAVAGRPENGPALEVLLRLRNADGGESLPLDFMQAAERYHLMPSLDRWVVQATFAAVGAGTLKLPPDRSVAINISGQTLGDPQFLEFVVECLDHGAVQPEQVCFELPESAVAAHHGHASRFIAVLHGLGCRFALDDFGSGLGSFANLKQLPMDYLKIDGSFIRGLGTDEVSTAMVTAMIELARSLGVKVIAEQVETERAFEVARALKVDFVQGYAIGRPVPLGAQAA